MEEMWMWHVRRQCTAGRLTDTQARCLHALQTFRGRGGLLFPAHETIAARAKRSVSTVKRALARAAELGLVRWAQRRVRIGWRWMLTSNAYELIVPGKPENPAKPTVAQSGRVASPEDTFSLLTAPDRVTSLAAVAAVLAERQRKIAQEWRDRKRTSDGSLDLPVSLP